MSDERPLVDISNPDPEAVSLANLALNTWPRRWHQVAQGLWMRPTVRRGWLRAFLAWRRIGYARDRGAIIRRGVPSEPAHGAVGGP